MLNKEVRPIATPSGELALAVDVRSALVTSPGLMPPYAAVNPDGTYTAGTATYNSMAWIPQDLAGGFGNYVFTFLEKCPFERWDGDFLTMYFAKPRTPLARATAWRSTSRFGNHPWPTELHGIKILQDNIFQRSSLTQDGAGNVGRSFASTNYLRKAIKPPMYEGTRFVLKQYQSEVPFRVGQYPVPAAATVSIDILGIREEIPECLHGGIEIPATTTGTTAVFAAGQVPMAGTVDGQKFRRTNFRRRAPYVISGDPHFDAGVWGLDILIVFPPGGQRVNLV